MHAMIARIMSPELSESHNPYLEIQSLIKLFLSIMKDIDIKIDKKRKKVILLQDHIVFNAY